MSDQAGKIVDVWVGGYTDKAGVGITRFSFDSGTRQLRKEAEFTGIDNPSFLTMDREGRYLYAVSEVAEVGDQPGGEVFAFEVREDGNALHERVSHSTLGAHPCFLMIDPQEKWLAAANYNGTSAVVYPLEDGGLPGPMHVRFRHSGTSAHPERQDKPHPHATVFSPDSRYLFVPDLGMDKIMVYALDESRQEWVGHDAVSMPPAAGPRHFRFHPNGRIAYVVNELDSTITRFTYDEPGALVRQESVTTIPAGYDGPNACAELAISPDGRFVYVSNRGHDSLAVLQADQQTGELLNVGFVSTRGRTPRHFAMTPDGGWLLVANKDSDALALFMIESQTGLPVFEGVELPVAKPVTVHIQPRF